MPSYTVECADPVTGEVRELFYTAKSPAHAAERANDDGHLVGAVRLASQDQGTEIDRIQAVERELPRWSRPPRYRPRPDRHNSSNGRRRRGPSGPSRLFVTVVALLGLALLILAMASDRS